LLVALNFKAVSSVGFDATKIKRVIFLSLRNPVKRAKTHLKRTAFIFYENC
jgi:hypothetical protein